MNIPKRFKHKKNTDFGKNHRASSLRSLLEKKQAQFG